MHILITDETNKEATKEIRYFIYGGIIVPADKIPALHDKVEQLRAEHKYPTSAELKFSTNTRPKEYAIEKFNALKGAIIDAAIKEKVQFIACLVPHAIAESQGTKKTVEYGLNTLLIKFDQFLRESGDHGLVFIDNPEIDVPFQYMSDVFLSGLKFPSGRRRLNHICALSITGAGTTHLSSLMDIILGTFRYCVNASKDTEVVTQLLPKVMRRMWGEMEGKTKNIRERGLLVRPQKMTQAYKEDIDALVARLIRLANSTEKNGA